MNRIEKLAKILVNESTKINKSDIVSLECRGEEGKPLFLAVYKELIKKQPKEILTDITFDETTKVYINNASEKQLKCIPKLKDYINRKVTAHIIIRATTNPDAMKGINPKKLAIRSKTVRKLFMHRLNNTKWVVVNYPTKAMAKAAKMSLKNYADFCFGATNIDWQKHSKYQDQIVKLLKGTDKVRIVAKDTDLTLSIKNRPPIKCDGKMNMPDGEVFFSPIKNSVNGTIRYTFPGLYNKTEVQDIKLTFKNGKVIKEEAKTNLKFLTTMLNTDPGARYLGELGIGTNPGIQKFSKDILFDEKMAGTVHLALGQSYKEAVEDNKSAIHWDMILDLRKGGELYVDDKLIQKNGKWIFK
jgi:aminopeptidase